MFGTWHSLYSRRKMNRRIVEKAACRLVGDQRAVAYARWVEFRQQSTSLRLSAARVVARLVHATVSHAFAHWRWFSIDNMRLKRCIAKLLARISTLDVANAFGKWMHCAEMSKHRIARARKLVVRLQQRLSSKALWRWSHHTRWRLRAQAIGQRMLLRWVSHSAAIVFSSWRERVRQHKRVRATLCRMKQTDLASAFLQWQSNCFKRRRLFAIADRVVARMLQGVLSTSLNRWVTFTDEKYWLHSIGRRLAHFQARRAWWNWVDAVDLLHAQRGDAQQKHQLSSLEANLEQQRASTLEWVQLRWLQRGEAMCFSTWKSWALTRARNDRILFRTLNRFAQRSLVKAFGTWADLKHAAEAIENNPVFSRLLVIKVQMYNRSVLISWMKVAKQDIELRQQISNLEEVGLYTEQAEEVQNRLLESEMKANRSQQLYEQVLERNEAEASRRLTKLQGELAAANIRLSSSGTAVDISLSGGVISPLSTPSRTPGGVGGGAASHPISVANPPQLSPPSPGGMLLNEGVPPPRATTLNLPPKIAPVERRELVRRASVVEAEKRMLDAFGQ